MDHGVARRDSNLCLVVNEAAYFDFVQLWETSANIEHDLDIEAINCTRFLSLTDQSAFILGLPKHLHFKRKRVYDTF